MPKYYCDYCKSYLTHDTMSVRKSHLQGRNHIKFYCDYYELKAKESNIWDPLDSKYEISLSKLNENAPSLRNFKMNNNNNKFKKLHNDDGLNEENDVNNIEIDNESDNDDDNDNDVLPPPPNLDDLPNPPPSIYRYTEDYQRAITKHLTPITKI